MQCLLSATAAVRMVGNDCSGCSYQGAYISGGSSTSVVAENDFRGSRLGLGLEGTACTADFSRQTPGLNGNRLGGSTCYRALILTSPPAGSTYSDLDFSGSSGIYGDLLYVSGGSDLTFEGVQAGGDPGVAYRGLYLDGCDGVTVRGCDLSGMTSRGVAAMTCKNVTLEGNVVGSPGAPIELAVQVWQFAGNVSIRRNTCSGSYNGIECSLKAGSTGSLALEENTVSGCSGTAISVDSAPATIKGNDVSGSANGLILKGPACGADFYRQSNLNDNNLAGCRYAIQLWNPPDGSAFGPSNLDFSGFAGIGRAIYVGGGKGLVFEGLKAGPGVQFGLDTMSCEDLTVRNCNFSGATERGATAWSANGVTYANNVARDVPGYALQVCYSQGTIEVYGNDCGGSDYGINCGAISPGTLRVYDNHVEACTGQGIHFERASGVVENNHCARSASGVVCQLSSGDFVEVRGNDATSAGLVGVAVVGGGALVEDNDCSGSNDTGIHCFGTADQVEIRNTPCSGCRGTGVYVEGGTGVLVSDCVLTGNGTGASFGNTQAAVVRGCSIAGNTYWGVQNRTAGPVVDARSNWWGDPTGPKDTEPPNGQSDGIGPNELGLGDWVSDFVLYDPWITALHTPPVVGEITAPTDPVPVSATVAASAAFSDASPLDTHTALWDWGDGSTSAGAVAEEGGCGSVTGEHGYGSAGVYTISLTVTDNHGDTGTSTFRYVVVYDPGGGFVTGGGWITSPLGAYVGDPNLTGKATFGFNSKYKKGATVPTGETEFQFKVAGLNFHSTAYDWLVVAGAKAQYKGAGTINGSGSYRFMLAAVDGQVNGGGGVDKFRIKIWDPTTGALVYDNQIGDVDSAVPATALGGGSIVIHKGVAGAAVITGASAVQTGMGGQIAFSLSADASVSAAVLNIAGRTVRVVCTDKAGTAGANTLLWDGRGGTGTKLPAGRYLVKVVARDESGGQSQVMIPLMLKR